MVDFFSRTSSLLIAGRFRRARFIWKGRLSTTSITAARTCTRPAADAGLMDRSEAGRSSQDRGLAHKPATFSLRPANEGVRCSSSNCLQFFGPLRIAVPPGRIPAASTGNFPSLSRQRADCV